MRKTLTILFVACFFVACGGKGKSGKQIAEEVCDCSKKANALPSSDPNRSIKQNDCLKQQRDAWEKLKDDPEKSKDFNAALAKCAEEQLEKSFGK